VTTQFNDRQQLVFKVNGGDDHTCGVGLSQAGGDLQVAGRQVVDHHGFALMQRPADNAMVATDQRSNHHHLVRSIILEQPQGVLVLGQIKERGLGVNHIDQDLQDVVGQAEQVMLAVEPVTDCFRPSGQPTLRFLFIVQVTKGGGHFIQGVT